ncbi:Hypothetical protein, putative [Bodo saltans]|uniref:Uncharacterized protein n=1 Tax=Bodo saltans TaxID=75058 RepID=A0A0S4IWI1_BODSA|nr:Hypothetical protein, putative [Bodo saltans]|eukprot:CUG05948.1 Hypothetical protein, putative [Bodo saltans]
MPASPQPSPRKALTPRRQPWNPPIVGPACIPPSVRLQSSDTAMAQAQSLVNNMVVSQQALDNDLRTIDADYASILHTAPGAKQTVWLSKYYIRRPGEGFFFSNRNSTSTAAITPRSSTKADRGSGTVVAPHRNDNEVVLTEDDLSSTANTNILATGVSAEAFAIPAAPSSSPPSPKRVVAGGSSPKKGHHPPPPQRNLSPSALGASSSSSRQLHEQQQQQTQQLLDQSLSLPNPNTGDLRGASFVGGLTPRAHRRLMENSGLPTPRGAGKNGASASETFLPSAYPDKMNWLHFDRKAESSRITKRQEALARVATTEESLLLSSSRGRHNNTEATLVPSSPPLLTKDELVAKYSAMLEAAVVDLTYRCEAHFLESGGHEDTWAFALDREDDLLGALGGLMATLHDEQGSSNSSPLGGQKDANYYHAVVDVKHLGTFLEAEGVGSWETTTSNSAESGVRRRSSAVRPSSASDDALIFAIRHKTADGAVTSAHRATFRRCKLLSCGCDVKHLGTFLEAEGVGSWETTTSNSAESGVRRRSSAVRPSSASDDALIFAIRHKTADGAVTSAHRATFRRLRAALQVYAVATPPLSHAEVARPDSIVSNTITINEDVGTVEVQQQPQQTSEDDVLASHTAATDVTEQLQPTAASSDAAES